MSRYYLIQDSKKCIRCHACEVECKVNKSLPAGPRLCQVVEVGPRLIGELPRSSYVFMPCYHCEKPWCIAACPTGAMQKRDDGIVFVEQEECVGVRPASRHVPGERLNGINRTGQWLNVITAWTDWMKGLNQPVYPFVLPAH